MQWICHAVVQRIKVFADVSRQLELLAAAHELAQKITRNAPLATAAAKRLINRGAEMNLRDAVAYETGIFGQLCTTADCKEGTAAFIKKRPAEWQGK